MLQKCQKCNILCLSDYIFSTFLCITYSVQYFREALSPKVIYSDLKLLDVCIFFTGDLNVVPGVTLL